jgi:WD40 repeat protein
MMPGNSVIDELVSRWDESRARGEETTVEELCRDHPELVDTVSQIIAQRQADPPGPTESSATASFSGSLDWQDGLRPPQQEGEIGRLGPFRVMNLLGAGGMGSVYRAIDVQLGRAVALKVMQTPRADAERARARFLREARTAAALQHDHVVPIYQFGEDNGVIYLAMPLLHGQTLRDRLKQRPALTLAEVLRIGRETAEGLAAAHELGLIHRDVKPGNIWLEEGSGRVKILDFGLARVADESEQVTQYGTVVGTPAFMAPEQARGREDSDYRGDLFSLGGLLYRMVTGKLPFPADHTTAMLLSLLSDDPIPPRQLNPAIPPALEALILRLLAKDPAARPRSARLVVEAIRAMEQTESSAGGSEWDITVQVENDDVLGSGRPPRPAAKRRFPIVPVAAVTFLLLGVAAGVTLRSRFPDRTADPETVQAPARIAPPGPPPLAQDPRPPQGPGPIRKTAVEAWPTPPPAHPRLPGLIPAPQPLAGLGRWQVETRSPRDAVLGLVWSPDHQRLACAAGEKVVRIYETGSLKLVALLVGHTRSVFCVDWSPDGRHLATGSGDGTVRLWSASGTPEQVLRGHSAAVWCVRWNHDGSRLASASNDHSVRVWNADGTMERLLEHSAPVVALAWNHEGSQLVSGAANVLHLWSTDGTPGPLLKGHTDTVHSVSWSADGTRIASASSDQTVRLWFPDGTSGPVLQHQDNRLRAVAWSPDSKRLAAAGGDSKVRIWTADGTQGPVLTGLTRTIDSVAWSADGKRVAAGSSAAEVRIWDAEGHAGPALVPLRAISAAGFSPDGTTIVSASAADPSLLVWGPDHIPGKVLKGRTKQVKAIALSADGSRIAAAGLDETVEIWHPDGTRGPVLSGHLGGVNAVAWSPDGNGLASASDDATARLWSAEGKPGPVLKGHQQRVLAVIWSPDGKRLATGGEDGSVLFWRADGTTQKPPVNSGFPVISLAWSADGTHLAVGNRGGALQLWGPDQPSSPPVTVKAGNADAIAWHPGSARLATANPLSIIRLWDVDGLPGPVLTTHLAPGDWREGGAAVAWTPYGDRLLAASRHGFVWAWNARTLATEWVAIQTSPTGVTLFTPEGRLLRSDPAALKNFVYMIERPDRSVELLTQQEFEEQSAGKW